MSTGPWRWKQSDMTRAAKAVQASGLPVRNVEVTADGTIRVNVGEPKTSSGPDTAPEAETSEKLRKLL